MYFQAEHLGPPVRRRRLADSLVMLAGANLTERLERPQLAELGRSIGNYNLTLAVRLSIGYCK
jgi:hypothetical protein